MNVRFVLRALLMALPLALLLGAGWVWLQTPWARPPDATPLPPTIQAAPGPVPSAAVGRRSLARYGDEAPRPVGSGFFLGLDSGQVVAVTAAHTVALGDSSRPLAALTFMQAGQEGTGVELDTLWGQPGRSLTPDDLAVDYLLLVVDQDVDPALILAPDPRGGPQPGERVLLYSGLGDGAGGVRRLAGTVQTAGERAVWVLMDDRFRAGQMSGSPIISQHTGRVVAMAVAGSPRRGAQLIGGHPIGSLVAHAARADGRHPLSKWNP